MGTASPKHAGRLAIGMDVGSTTVKAVVVNPANQGDPLERLPAAPHEAARVRAVDARDDPRGVPRVSRRAHWRMFLTGSGSGAALRADRRQVRPGGQRRHARRSSTCTRTSARSSSSAGKTPKIIMFKKDEKGGGKTATASMNDKCASRHGRHHRQVLPQGERAAGDGDEPPLRRLEAAPRRGQVRRLRRDRHRQPHQERHPVERGPLLARRRDRPAEPLGPHARRHAQAPRAPARRAQHVPAVPPGVLAPAHPADVGRARLRVPEGRARSRSSSSSRRTRSTTRRSARCSTACTRTTSVGVLDASLDGLREYMTNGRKARLGETAGPPLSKNGAGARRLPRAATASRSSSPPTFTPGRGRARGHRPRRRVDVEQGGARRLRDGRHPLQGVPALEGQPDPGHQGAPRAAPRRTSRRTRRRSSRSWASARPATRPTCSRSACAPT